MLQPKLPTFLPLCADRIVVPDSSREFLTREIGTRSSGEVGGKVCIVATVENAFVALGPGRGVEHADIVKGAANNSSLLAQLKLPNELFKLKGTVDAVVVPGVIIRGGLFLLNLNTGRLVVSGDSSRFGPLDGPNGIVFSDGRPASQVLKQILLSLTPFAAQPTPEPNALQQSPEIDLRDISFRFGKNN